MNGSVSRTLAGIGSDLPDRLNADPEFALAARTWTGCLHFAVGGERVVLRLEDGRAAACGEAREPPQPGDVEIRGSQEGWRCLLEAVPRPFFHDVVAAAAHEGFALGGDMPTFYAYYPAIRRLMDLLREEPR